MTARPRCVRGNRVYGLPWGAEITPGFFEYLPTRVVETSACRLFADRSLLAWDLVRRFDLLRYGSRDAAVMRVAQMVATGNTMSAKQHCDLKLHLHHVPVEIERKFLITNDAWKDSVVSKVTIRDGLIAVYKDRKVRVRISDQIATITIKGPRHGIARAEYEYEIPIADAELILSICQDDTLQKQRYLVDHAGTTWYVDVYGGILEGVVIAEIELKQEDQTLVFPHWIGREVTGDAFYKKLNMVAARRAKLERTQDRRA